MALEGSLPPSPSPRMQLDTHVAVDPFRWSSPESKWQLRVTYFCNSVIGAKKDEDNRLDLKLTARNTPVLFGVVALSEG
jgi:hypothetical protein